MAPHGALSGKAATKCSRPRRATRQRALISEQGFALRPDLERGFEQVLQAGGAARGAQHAEPAVGGQLAQRPRVRRRKAAPGAARRAGLW